jgi:hypothetical protein
MPCGERGHLSAPAQIYFSSRGKEVDARNSHDHLLFSPMVPYEDIPVPPCGVSPTLRARSEETLGNVDSDSLGGRASFPTITSYHWAVQLRRARGLKNSASDQIRLRLAR